MLYKKWTDYLDDIYKEYPHIPKFIIKMIVSFGLRWIYRISCSRRNGIIINDGRFEFGVGNIKEKTDKKQQKEKKHQKTINEEYFIPSWIEMSPFEGYYYIPIQYHSLLGLKRDKINILKNIFVTTSPEIAKLKGLYVIRVKSFKNIGPCGKMKKISFVDYDVIQRDSNFRIDYYRNKIKEDVREKNGCEYL